MKVFKSEKLVFAKQNEVISAEHEDLQAEHRDVIESITYAQRIQSAILPFVEDVQNVFPHSFMIYRPKDVVAGDFYWIHQTKNNMLFAVADCTGHGVPGAMVSVICINALNRAVREHDIHNPAEVLDKTKEILLSEFEQSKVDLKDGMDIALCGIEGNKLSYSGANSPLWLMREGTIEEYRPNKQPVGKYLFSKKFSTSRH